MKHTEDWLNGYVACAIDAINIARISINKKYKGKFIKQLIGILLDCIDYRNEEDKNGE